MYNEKYIIFEKVFVSFCRKSFTLPETHYYDYRGTIKKSAESIDRFILIPAGFTFKDRNEHFGVDNGLLSKSLLSGFRTGKTKLRDYIIDTYSNNDAVRLTNDYFSNFLPLVINEADKIELLSMLVKQLKIDKISQDSIENSVSTGNYYALLTKVFIYSITENEAIFNENPFIIKTSQAMKAFIDGFVREGVNDATLQMLDSIYEAQWLLIDNNTLIDEVRAIQQKGHTSIPFDDVVTFFIVEYEKELDDKKHVAQELDDEYKMLWSRESRVFDSYSIKYLDREMFRQLITDAACIRKGYEPLLGDIICESYSIGIKYSFAKKVDDSRYLFDINFVDNQAYSEDDVFAFSCALLRYLGELDEKHKKRASRLMDHCFDKRKKYLMKHYGREKAMSMTCDLWRYRFSGRFYDFSFGIPVIEKIAQNENFDIDVCGLMNSVLIDYTRLK